MMVSTVCHVKVVLLASVFVYMSFSSLMPHLKSSLFVVLGLCDAKTQPLCSAW